MMTAEQLKASILQMAMQGKLVEQRAEEGTGEDLLKQIAEVKNRLFKTGKFKKVNKLADINSEEILFDIPESWTWVRLNYFGQFSSGKTPSMSDAGNWGGNIPWTTSKDMKSDVIHDSMMHITKKAADQMHIYPAGTLLMVVRSGILKRSLPLCILGIDSTINQDLKAFEFYDDQVFQWIYYALKGFEPYILKNLVKRVTTVDSLKFDEFSNLALPFPPLEEQKRIVAKIEELMPFVEQYAKASTRLNTLNASFPDQMKKSILQQAVMGKLVPQDPNDEPASVLLKKIAEEKQKLIKEGKIKKQKALPAITEEEIPFDIPESWEWVRLGAIITDTEAGKSPQCNNRPATSEEWGVIKTTAIQDGYFLAEENKVLPDNFEIKEAQVVHVDDLLITRAGPQNRTGITCIVDEEPHNLILSDKTVRLMYVKGLVNPKYLMYALKSPAVQKFITETKSGMAASQVNISQDKMRLFVIPLPPLNEQQRIVDGLERALPSLTKFLEKFK